MARTPEKKRAVSEACRNYRFNTDDRCEVSDILTIDRDAVKWMSNCNIDGLETHHIFGRGNKPEYDYYANLILVSKAAHMWGHDFHPASFEIACLFAKFERDRRQIVRAALNLTRPVFVESLSHWNPNAMVAICGAVSLFGRIHMLLPKVTGTPFEAIADQLLLVLGDE